MKHDYTMKCADGAVFDASAKYIDGAMFEAGMMAIVRETKVELYEDGILIDTFDGMEG